MNAPVPAPGPRGAATAARFDLYQSVHKGIRRMLSRAVEAVGSADPRRAPERAAALALVDDALAISAWHADAEDAHIHAALAAANAAAVAPFDAEHEAHHRDIDGLAAQAAALREAAPTAGAWHDFHLRFARFAAVSMLHMDAEEREMNPALWLAFDDDHLRGIQTAILAELGPRMLAFLRHMFPAISPAERVRLLEGPGRQAPPATAAAVRRTARATLDAVALARLGDLAAERDADGAVLLVITFPFTGPFGAAMSAAFAELARTIAVAPGFKWKVWAEDEDRGRAAGVYLFASRADADSYLRVHADRLEGFGVSGIDAEVFSVNAPLSIVGHAPWAAG